MAKVVAAEQPAEARSLLPQWATGVLPQVGLLALIALLGLYILYPILLLFVNSFNVARIGQPAQYAPDAWLAAFSSPGVATAFWNSISIGLVQQAIAFPAAIFIAWLLARTNVPWARGLEFMFWLSFFMPTLSIALGWILLLDPRVGVINQFLVKTFGLTAAPFDIYGYWGIIWVHLVAHAISLKVMLLVPAFRRMDAALEEASRVMGGSNLGTFLRVTIPVMTPTLIVVLLLSLLRMFESFEIERLLGVPVGLYVYSTEIVRLVRQEPPLTGQATALGSATLVLLLVLLPFERWLSHRRQYTTVTSRMKPEVLDLGAWRWLAFASLLLVGLVLVVLPLFSVIAGSLMTRFGFFDIPQPWSLRHWQAALGDPVFIRSITNTLTIATIAGLVGPMLFSFIAYTVVRTTLWGRGLLDTLLWLPSVVPGVLTGLGLLWMFLGVPLFNPLYGTIFLLLIASTMSGMTLASQLMKASFLQLGREIEDAARVHGAGWWRTYFQVVLPTMVPTLILIGVLKFMFAAQNTSTIILLATSESRTLSLLTLDFVSEGRREAATVNAVLILVLTTGVALLARAFGLRVGFRQ